MANVKKKEDIKKEEPVVAEQPLLLTEEEFARRQRKKNKERINKVIRVVGLVSTFIIFYCAVFDILFEPSYFGWMFYAIKGGESSPHDLYWTLVQQAGIYGDTFQFGVWLPKLGMTFLLIASFVVVLYLTIYCIIDAVELIRAIINLTKDLTNDLESTANDGGISLKRKKKPEPEPFTPTKKPAPRRRKDNSTLDNMTDDDLDKILRGEMNLDDKLEKEIEKTKDLFAEDDE